MSTPILIDMNLSPEWVLVLTQAGWDAVHWSQIGASDAEDRVIMDWARANGRVVFTHDLDFGMLLALTHASRPSVIQIRSRRILPKDASTTVLAALEQFQPELTAGALVVVEESTSRVRILPF